MNCRESLKSVHQCRQVGFRSQGRHANRYRCQSPRLHNHFDMKTPYQRFCMKSAYVQTSTYINTTVTSFMKRTYNFFTIDVHQESSKAAHSIMCCVFINQCCLSDAISCNVQDAPLTSSSGMGFLNKQMHGHESLLPEDTELQRWSRHGHRTGTEICKDLTTPQNLEQLFSR